MSGRRRRRLTELELGRRPERLEQPLPKAAPPCPRPALPCPSSAPTRRRRRRPLLGQCHREDGDVSDGWAGGHGQHHAGKLALGRGRRWLVPQAVRPRRLGRARLVADQHYT